MLPGGPAAAGTRPEGPVQVPASGPSPAGASACVTAGGAAACFRASFLACLRRRRSRTAFSRLSFAIVVFFLAFDAMRSCPFVVGRVPPAGDRRDLREKGLDRLNVRRVGALGPYLGVVADLRSLGERLEAAAGDRAVVHEQVLALIVGRDEPEALLVTEPLHGSGCHCCSL